MQTYELIEAESPEAAVAKSRWHVGQAARCVALTAYPDPLRSGTWTVSPTFEPLVPEQKEDPTGLLDGREGASHRPDHLYVLPPTELPVVESDHLRRAVKVPRGPRIGEEDDSA